MLDHLQSMCAFKSKLFHIHGEKAHPLIWEGFGFELHLPEHTFLPDEECCIKVEAVIGGDFVIPEGVEPVSTIYIISVTTKLRQPSLLKIQHCVDLEKAHPDSRLSFYRASLKESFPPYYFKRVDGGKFNSLDKYGELELPVFCAQLIGKDKGSSSGSDVSNDAPLTEDTNGIQTGEDGAASFSSGFSDMADHHTDESLSVSNQPGELFNCCAKILSISNICIIMLYSATFACNHSKRYCHCLIVILSGHIVTQCVMYYTDVVRIIVTLISLYECARPIQYNRGKKCTSSDASSAINDIFMKLMYNPLSRFFYLSRYQYRVSW